MNKTVVFILSTNFAGSHFASLLVGSHSRALHVGELRHYRKRRSQTQRVACRVCDEGCRLLAGASPECVDRVHEIIFDNAGGDITALVDTSKKVKWAARFVASSAYEKKFLHLIRDPRALAWRWDSYYGRSREARAQRLKWARRNPTALPRLLFAPPRELYMHKWLRQNRDISRFIRRHRLDHRVVSYHDLAQHTADQLRELMAWIGLDFEPGQLDYWNFDHHGTQKAEYEWVKQQQVRLFDTRWKGFVTAEESRRIASHRGVTRYLASLGLRMVDDGITAALAQARIGSAARAR